MPMTVYLTERYLPGITLEQLTAVSAVARDTSRRFTAEGKPVRYIRSLFVPGEGRCLCQFEAATARVIQEVNEAAQLPFTRIIEVWELSS